MAEVFTCVVVGGPMDGTKVEADMDLDQIEICGGDGKRARYLRSTIAAEDVRYHFCRAEELSTSQVIWALFTRYHGG